MIVLKFENDVISIPASISKYYREATEIDLKVLLCLCSDAELRQCDNVAERVSKRLKCRIKLVKESINYWIETGIIADEDVPQNYDKRESWTFTDVEEQSVSEEVREKAVPVKREANYTGEEIEELLDGGNGERRQLLIVCQGIFNKMFNQNEVSRLMGMSDYLGLPNDYIMLLFKYCHDMGKGSVAYVDRLAGEFLDRGINTYEALEEYIKREDQKKKREGRLRVMFGIGARAYTKTEKDMISKWYDTYGFGDEIIDYAFEKTVSGTGNNMFSFPYMDGILTRWHNEGNDTMQKIVASEVSFRENRKKNDESKAQSKSSAKSGGGSFDTDEFLKAAKNRKN